MKIKLDKFKNHIYQNRAKYTALVTIPTMYVVMSNHYKPYVEIGKVMAVFIHDHDLGQRFLDVVEEVNKAAKV